MPLLLTSIRQVMVTTTFMLVAVSSIRTMMVTTTSLLLVLTFIRSVMQANEKPRKPPGENVVESDYTNQTFQFQQWFEVNSSNPKGEVNLVNCVNIEEQIRCEE